MNDAGDSAATCRLARPRPLPLAQPEERYIPGVGLVIGDLSCEFNARSPQLRCTVNPYGPCQGCGSYQPLAIDPKQKQGN
ncbi:MAG: hypothetical protein HC824_21300 [Synechococcales cyanobacterium RM1_1_8]|nr:hypothetical protein [Synechococcales cyanobacterium RM1_1_8]